VLILILTAGLAATLLGGFTPRAGVFADRAGLARLLAFRSGILIAVAFTDILPDAWALGPRSAGWGALAAFAFCYAAENFTVADSCHEELEGCRSHKLGGPAMAGLFVHSLLDGVNLGATSLSASSALLAVGAATVLHKLADGFTLTSLFRQAGFSYKVSLGALAAVAFATPLGAILSRAGVIGLGPTATSLLLGFAGGSFLYIGASDIIPRLHRDGAAFISFGAGLAAMLLMRGISR
jgi:ZIP family zinc transporter/zinc and cadmium transporter